MASPWAFSKCTTEFFRAFLHSERALYYLIAMGLGRDPTDAMKVFAFWLWLERTPYGFKNIIHKIRGFPHSLIDTIVDESLLCLSCINSEFFPYGSNAVEIPIIQGLCEGHYKNLVSVNFFHSNRIVVIRGVVEFFNNVCLRAFGDIAQQAQTMRTSDASSSSSNGKASISNAMQQMIIPMARPLYIEDSMVMAAQANGEASSSTRTDVVEDFLPSQAELENAMAMALVPENGEGGRRDWDHIQNDPELDIDWLVYEQEIMEEIEQGRGREQRQERTLFLTFSRGYTLTEEEVAEFFSMKYGDIVEAVEMQPVNTGQQPMYARVVLHHSLIIGKVLKGYFRVKLNINGKHVCARKYEKKCHD